MTNVVQYFVGQDGAETAIQSIKLLHPKTLARSLALLDILEEEMLPSELNIPIICNVHSSNKSDDSLRNLNILKARIGKTKLKFGYLLDNSQAIVLTCGEQCKNQSLTKILSDFQKSANVKAKSTKLASKAPIFKSHRELVAELTLSDPILAAFYSKARERTQFALSLIRLRDSASLTNDLLAQRTGLTSKLITRLTRGRLPNLATMRLLADALQARVVIGPAGGIVLEANTSSTILQPKPHEHIAHTHEPSDRFSVGDLLLVQ
jgi:transcriptional regulator with XRE-family HTH domain